MRFLLSVEHTSPQIPSDPGTGDTDAEFGKIGDRRGVVLPANKASTGKAMLAQMTRSQVQTVFQNTVRLRDGSTNAAWLNRLMNELAVIRARGFATNFEGTETGVSAIGVAIHDGDGTPIAGLSISIPHARFSTVVDTGLVGNLQQAKTDLQDSLADFTAHG